ncbi:MULTISPECIES: helix-turn-helix domain-containing protein [Peribacillus]|uniref:HTH-type transcriptional regulator ImmR n=1 Tax=Peribacillus simplex TaxID=1478 RepID=A0A9W4KTQ7_9BACI|nr:helix-turn-helix domain-containing protein [Peribacillus simplex]CAH0187508.1 HTH-type transcriptional regulator ImmR [Peribacillus simplex]
MVFGKNFLEARNRKGVDQKDAAAALDITPGYLSRVEKDKTKPSLDLILKAADYYGVEEGYFFLKNDDIDLDSLYTQHNKKFIKEMDLLPANKLRDKYNITLDGEELTESELKGVIAYLRSLRSME